MASMNLATAMRTILTKALPAVIWAGLTAFTLLVPGESLQEVGGWFELPRWLEPWADKLMHFGLFLVLALLVWRFFESVPGDSRAGSKTLAVSIVYMVALEAAQIGVPGRGWEILDLVAGGAGILTALVLTELHRSRGKA